MDPYVLPKNFGSSNCHETPNQLVNEAAAKLHGFYHRPIGVWNAPYPKKTEKKALTLLGNPP